MDIRYEYVNGEGVGGARYVILGADGLVLATGVVNPSGEAHVEGLPADTASVRYHFDDDPGRLQHRPDPPLSRGRRARSGGERPHTLREGRATGLSNPK